MIAIDEKNKRKNIEVNKRMSFFQCKIIHALQLIQDLIFGIS